MSESLIGFIPLWPPQPFGSRWQNRTDTYTGHLLPRIPFSNSSHLVSGLVIGKYAGGFRVDW